jgi:hyperosmotically inducible protein
MDDRQLRQDILDELELEPALNAKHIGIAVSRGVVTLTGHVATLGEKVAAEAIVRRVEGVRAITEDLAVVLEDDELLTDDELAERALNILKWDTSVPSERLLLSVDNGKVTLDGEVTWNCQRTAAEEAIRRLSGVRSVVNNIAVRPRAQAANIQEIIQGALRRNIGIDQKAIRVSLRDANTVVLEGTVRSLQEKKAVEDAAWCALGVENVENRLTLAEKQSG